jgi:hypothetical protein
VLARGCDRGAPLHICASECASKPKISIILLIFLMLYVMDTDMLIGALERGLAAKAA